MPIWTWRKVDDLHTTLPQALRLLNQRLGALATTIAPPGESRRMPDLSAYLRNNAVATVLDFALEGVDITTGVNDASSAFVAAYGARDRVRIPAAQYYKLLTGLTPPNWKILEGDGYGSQLVYLGAAGACLTLGTSDAVLNKKGRISDLLIGLNEKTSTAIKLNACDGATLRDLYLEGDLTHGLAGRTNVGVDISGADVSGFFNAIEHVNCNHMHTGFRVGGGTVRPTQQLFLNCTAFGDFSAGDTTSTGFQFLSSPADSGEGSTILGGNVENCGIGIDIDTAGITVIGVRFEISGGATAAIRFGVNARNCYVVGCSGLRRAQIVDLSPAGSNNVVILPAEEENTFTVTMTAGTSGTITLNSSGTKCKWWREGKRVTVQGYVVVSAVAAPVGELRLNGLPFPVRTGAEYTAPVTLHVEALAAGATTAIQGYAEPATSRLVFTEFAAGAFSALAGNVQAGSGFVFSCTYLTD